MTGQPAVHLSSINGVWHRSGLRFLRLLPGVLLNNLSTRWLLADARGEAQSFLTIPSHCPSVS